MPFLLILSVSDLLKAVGFCVSKLRKTQETSKSNDFEVFGGDKRNQTADILNAIGKIRKSNVSNAYIYP